MMPAPESRSRPAASMSSAAPRIAVRRSSHSRCAGPPAASTISAAIAAACGAAAEVPLNGPNPGVAVDTPSAAAISGVSSTFPPVAEKSPGVTAVPSASKNMRRGPFEL